MTDRVPRQLSAVRVLIAMTFLTVIGGAAIPSAMRHRTEDRCQRMIALSEEIADACRRHRNDTTLLAIEFSPPQASHEWASSSFHRLSMKQFYEGWDGPYLSRPLDAADNPYTGSVFLRSDWKQAAELGFSAEGKGFGQYLVFDRIPARAAYYIERELDGGDGKDLSSTWNKEGRVRWREKGGRLLIDLEVSR